jgi:hypothetical protein
MEQVDLSNSSFQALSYVWGSNERPFRAFIFDKDGKNLGFIQLTKNLNSALRDLWMAEKIVNKTFWIDQICINQEGEEKGQQVALMREIYTKAERVITYLGAAGAEEQEERGIELLNTLDNYLAPNYDLIAGTTTTASLHDIQPQFPVQKLSDDITKSTTEEDWQWLAAICFGEWATRLWIIQEQVLGVQNVMLRGHRLVRWETVAVLPVFFALVLLPTGPLHVYWGKAQKPPASLPWDFVVSRLSIWRKRREKRQPGTTSITLNTLYENIANSWALQCSDPRDRIYALLSVSSDATLLQIAPDYSIPIDILIRMVSISVLQNAKDLDFLTASCVPQNTTSHSLPSWAVNIPKPEMPRGTFLYLGRFAAHPRLKLIEPVRFNPDKSILILKGRIVDEVTMSILPLYPSPSAHIGGVDATHLKTLLHTFDIICQILQSTGINEKSADSVCRAIVAEASWKPTGDYESPNTAGAHHLWCYMRDFASTTNAIAETIGQDIDDQMRLPNQTMDTLAEVLSASGVQCSLPTEPLSSVEQQMVENVWENSRFAGRSFCTTSKNNICTIANVAKESDSIVALEGSDRLWALRPVGASSRPESSITYQIIGDAFIGGLMNGEAYKGLDPDKVDYDLRIV